MSHIPDSSVPDGDGLTPSAEEPSAGEKNRRHGIFQRFLDGVELVGNKRLFADEGVETGPSGLGVAVSG